MLVVGASLARAFGIVGAAGLVRYRAKIDDPKDAGVMLSTLAVGLAAGVGLWMLALFATVFILVVLVDHRVVRAEGDARFTLKIKAKDPAALKPKVEQLLRRAKLEYELRDRRRKKSCATTCRCRSTTHRSPAGSHPEDRSGKHDRGRMEGEEREEVEASGLPVVAELQRDAEIVVAQRLHRLLQVVLRRRADAHLIGLDRRLDLLQLLVLDELDDLARRLDRDALLNRDDAPDRAAGRRLARA